ncbi:MAG TPA: glutamate--tRNA ligase [Bacteroidota bacterium]|nr:glutamate--tRNA ligase [Bacteroidota bacterium]
MTDKLTVRFAPSPTGYLHVGGARTAIFNWLYARSAGGRFLLRIEDTDRQRSSEEMTREILNGLRWLGLDWDEEPVLQSTRVERHREECLRLLEQGRAYWCYCSQEQLDEKRSAAEAAGGAFLYDRHCRNLSEEDRAAKDAAGAGKVLRFRVPDGHTTFSDIVHDETSFNNDEIDDFVLLRSDGTPTYMVAVVVDDHDMGVTHVLRGDDHLSNTPKQLLLYHAFDYEAPVFGHLPLILGADKKRLSKRHGATSLGEFQQQGFLPEAMFNFLALLGWSPGDDRELMSRNELVQAFDVRRILKKSSVFDEDKLRWMNGQHIRLLDEETLLERVLPFRPQAKSEVDEARLRPILTLLRERMIVLPDFFTAGQYFFEDPTTFDEAVVVKQWKAPLPSLLRELRDELRASAFDAASLEALIRGAAERHGIGAGKLIHPLRLALTGQGNSPSLFDMMEVLGKETCLRRLDRAFEVLGIPDAPVV